MKKILLPVDGSDTCTKSYDLAKEFGEKFGASVVLFHVQPQLTQWVYKPENIHNTHEELKEVSDAIIKNAMTYFKDSSVHVTSEAALGDPASLIIDTAKEHECDMIIMCTHGMSAVKRFTLGSVTNKVVHYSEIPVLVVR